MIVLVHGPDTLLARDEVAKLVATHDPDGLNTTTLDGREASLPSIIAAVGSVGFFSDTRVVVVRNLMARATRAPAQQSTVDESGDTSTALDLAPLFKAVPEQNVLILLDPELTSIPAAVKKAAPAGTTVIAAAVPRGRPLVEWVIQTAEAAGGSIDRRAAEVLLQSLYPQTWSAAPSNPRYDRPPDTEHLRNEVERLVLYAHPGQVTPGHVQDLVERGPNDRVFRFIDAVIGGQLDAAAAELERLLLAGEEPAKLVAQLHQQVELAALVAVAPAEKPPAAIGSEVALSNPARLNAVAASIRGRPPRSTLGAVAQATSVDRGLKTGRLRQPVDALYQLIIDLSRHSNLQGGA
jgi:DNA polymerase III delta subunit